MENILKNKKVLIGVVVLLVVVIAVAVVKTGKKSPSEKLSELLAAESTVAGPVRQETTEETEFTEETVSDENITEEATTEFILTTSVGEKIVSESYDVLSYVSDGVFYCRNLADNSEPVILMKSGSDENFSIQGEEPWIIYYSDGYELIRYDLKQGEKKSVCRNDDGLSRYEIKISDEGEFISEHEEKLRLIENDVDNDKLDLIYPIEASEDGQKVAYTQQSDEEGSVESSLYVKNGTNPAKLVKKGEFINIDTVAEDFSELFFTSQYGLYKTDFDGNITVISESTRVTDGVDGCSIIALDDMTAYYLANEDVAPGTNRELHLYYYDSHNSILIEKDILDMGSAANGEHIIYRKSENEIYCLTGTKSEKINLPKEFYYYDIITEINDTLYYSLDEKYYKIKLNSYSEPVELTNVSEVNRIYPEYEGEFFYKGTDNCLYAGDKKIAQDITDYEIIGESIFYSQSDSSNYRYKNGKTDFISKGDRIIASFEE